MAFGICEGVPLFLAASLTGSGQGFAERAYPVLAAWKRFSPEPKGFDRPGIPDDFLHGPDEHCLDFFMPGLSIDVESRDLVYHIVAELNAGSLGFSRHENVEYLPSLREFPGQRDARDSQVAVGGEGIGDAGGIKGLSNLEGNKLRLQDRSRRRRQHKGPIARYNYGGGSAGHVGQYGNPFTKDLGSGGSRAVGARPPPGENPCPDAEECKIGQEIFGFLVGGQDDEKRRARPLVEPGGDHGKESVLGFGNLHRKR